MHNSHDIPQAIANAGDQILRAYDAGQWVGSLHREFETFEPFDTPVTEYPLCGYARNAREILSGRDAEDVRYLVMFAQWAVQSDPIGQITMLADQDFEKWAELIGRSNETLPQILRRRRSTVKIGELDLRPHAKWQEVFAALCLAYIGRAINKGTFSSMEAAECSQIALSYSERSSSAKHKSDYWQGKAVRYAAAKDGISASQLAKDFICQNRNEMLKDRGRAYSQRTVAGWISKHRPNLRIA